MLPRQAVTYIVLLNALNAHGGYIDIVKRSQIQAKTSAVLNRIMNNPPITWKLRSRTIVPSHSQLITVEFTTRSVLRPRTYQFSQNGIVGIKQDIFEDTIQRTDSINSKLDKMDATAIKSNLFVGKLLKRPHAKGRFIRDTKTSCTTENGLGDQSLRAVRARKLEKVFKPLSGLYIIETILKSDRMNPLKPQFWRFVRDRVANGIYRLKKYLKGDSIAHTLKATHLWESSYGRSLKEEITETSGMQEHSVNSVNIFD